MIFRRSSVDQSEAETAPETMSEPKGAAKGFRVWVIAGSSIFLGVVLSVAVALAIQRHNDRVLDAQVAQSESELRTLGAQIAAIKDRQFGTMSEYVAAYARVEPLLKDYDQKLQQYGELCSTAQQRDQKRGLINIRRLYNRYNTEVWRNNSEILELVRQVNEVTKKRGVGHSRHGFAPCGRTSAVLARRIHAACGAGTRSTRATVVGWAESIAR